jgi:hypothetical protein
MSQQVEVKKIITPEKKITAKKTHKTSVSVVTFALEK